jgi:hypothetical protein
MTQSKNKRLPLLAALALGPLLAAAAALASEPTAPAGPDIVFSAGRQGGGYWGVAERMQGVGAESGLRIEVPSGEAVYELIDLPLVRSGLGSAGRTLPTVCTKGLLVTSPRKLAAGIEGRLKRLVDFEWMRIYPTDS